MTMRSETKTPPGGARTPEERHKLIAQSAYLKAERRGFQSSPEEDWLEAEAEFDALPVDSGSSIRLKRKGGSKP